MNACKEYLDKCRQLADANSFKIETDTKKCDIPREALHLAYNIYRNSVDFISHRGDCEEIWATGNGTETYPWYSDYDSLSWSRDKSYLQFLWVNVTFRYQNYNTEQKRWMFQLIQLRNNLIEVPFHSSFGTLKGAIGKWIGLPPCMIRMYPKHDKMEQWDDNLRMYANGVTHGEDVYFSLRLPNMNSCNVCTTLSNYSCFEKEWSRLGWLIQDRISKIKDHVSTNHPDLDDDSSLYIDTLFQ
jgi:hypothetical protein